MIPRSSKSHLTKASDIAEDAIFKLSVAVTKEHQSISHSEFDILIVFRLLVTVTCNCVRLDLPAMLGVHFGGVSAYVNYISFGLIAMYMTLMITSAIYNYRVDVVDSRIVSVKILAHGMQAFRYIVFPVAVWSMAFESVSLYRNLVALAFGVVGCLAGLLCLTITDLFLHSTIPSQAATCCLNVKYILALDVVSAVLIIVGIMCKMSVFEVSRVFFMISNLFIQIICLSMVVMFPPFWRSSSNRIYIAYYTLTSMIAIWNFPMELSKSSQVHWAALILIGSLIYRVADRLAQLQETICALDKNSYKYLRLRSLVLVSRLFDKKWKGDINETEMMTLHAFTMQMADRCRQLRRPVADVDVACASCGGLALFMAEVGEDDLRSVTIAKFELISRLMAPSDNILKSFLALKRFTQLVGSSPVARIEARYYKLLFEARLKAFYYLRPEDKCTNETVIEQLFVRYVVNAKQNYSTKVADICMPLNNKQLALSVNSLILNSIKSRHSIFTYIAINRQKNKKIDAHALFRMNCHTHEALNDARSISRLAMSSIKLPPSYFYPPMFILKSIMMHDLSAGRKLLVDMKKNMDKWDILKARHQSLRLDVMDEHSAVLQVSLHHHDRGKIVDATANWPSVLGDVDDGTIIDRNINDMFINRLQQTHLIMMKNSYGLTKLLNTKRDFFIQGFDGDFKEIIFTLRLWPSLSHDLAGVVSIGPSGSQRLGHNMVLLTENMDIIDAEAAFWSNIGQDCDGKYPTNLNDIVCRVNIIKRLLVCFHTLQDEARKYRILEQRGTIMEGLLRIGDVLRIYNDGCSLMYRVDRDSKFASSLAGVAMLCRVKTTSFMEVVLNQVYVKFGVGETEQSHGVDSYTLHGSLTSYDLSLTPNMNMIYRNADASLDKDPFKNISKSREELDNKLKKWLDEEKPTDVNDILFELVNCLGNVDSETVKLCPLEFQDNLIELGAICNEYRELENVKRLNTRGSTPHPALINKIEQSSSNMMKNLSKPMQKSGIFTSYDVLGLTPKIDLKNISPTLNFDEMRKGMIQTTNYLKTGHKKMKSMRLPSIEDEEGPGAVLDTGVNLIDDKDGSYSDREMPHKKIKDEKDELIGFASKSKEQPDSARRRYGKARRTKKTKENQMDHMVAEIGGSSVAGESEIGIAMNERKVKLWLTNRRKKYLTWVYVSGITLLCINYLICWLIFYTTLKNLDTVTRSKMDAVQHNDMMSIYGSSGLSNYLNIMDYYYSYSNEIIGEDESDAIYKYYMTYDVIGKITDDTNKTIEMMWGSLQGLAEILNIDDQFIGSDKTEWFKKPESDTGDFDNSSYKGTLKIRYFQEMTRLTQTMTHLYTSTLLGTDAELSDYRMESYSGYLVNDGLRSSIKLAVDLSTYLVSVQEWQVYEVLARWLIVGGLTASALCAVLILVALYCVQKRLGLSLIAYENLKHTDIMYELSKLMYAINFMNDSHIFDEKEKLRQIKIVNASRQDKGVAQAYAESLVSVKSDLSNYNKKFTQGLVKSDNLLFIKQRSRIASLKLFSSVTCAISATVVLYLLMAGAIFMFWLIDTEMRKNFKLKYTLEKSAFYVTILDYDFNNCMLISPYGISEMTQQTWEHVYMTATNYKERQQNLLEFWHSSRQQLADILGKGNRLDTAIFKDFCHEIEQQKSTDKILMKKCMEMNEGIAMNGFLAYTFYESEAIDHFLQDLQTIGSFNQTSMSNLKTPQAIAELAKIYYSKAILQLRLTHMPLYQAAMQFIFSLIKTELDMQIKKVVSIVDLLSITSIVFILMPTVVIILITRRRIEYQKRLAATTYNNISPDTICGNQFIFAKFKMFFKTASY